MRVLADNGDLHTPTGHIAVGWLVVEDLFTVLVLVLLPAVFGPGGAGAGGVVAGRRRWPWSSSRRWSALTFLVGERLIPWLLDRVAATRSRELFTLTVLVVALGIAVGSAKLFGVSMALGAFLAGMVVGRSEFSLQGGDRGAADAGRLRRPLLRLGRDALQTRITWSSRPGLVAATLAVILLGKPLAALAIVLLLKYPLRAAISVAVALAQIGEFSFILAAAGKSLGLLDDRATNTLIAAAIISITLNPLLYRLVGPLDRLLRRFVRTPVPSDLVTRPGTTDEQAVAGSVERYRAVIVGYGPVGRTLARLLRENQFEPVVIELNMETVRDVSSREGSGRSTATRRIARPWSKPGSVPPSGSS